MGNCLSSKSDEAGSTGTGKETLAQGLINAVDGDHSLVAFSDKPFYQLEDVKRWNLSIPVTPVAVTYPKTSTQVAAIIKCAAAHNVKVQPKSGGHSYGNYCLGGVDGAVVIDLKLFQQFSMDRSTWRATIGGGTLLGDVTKRLHDAGGRAMAHGTCPAVGIGGHATIGGLGPTSRQWGSALDHVEEVEVVLASSAIVRASPTKNPDIFWALKGAGASFGVVTEFIVRTEPEPGEIVQYSYRFQAGSWLDKAQTFKDWQSFVTNPALTRKLATEVVLTEVGMVITGAYFGPKAEYDALGFHEKFFHSEEDADVIIFNDWLGAVGQWAETVALFFGSGLPCDMFSKSLTFNQLNLIPDAVINEMFAFIERTSKGTLLWFVIFDLEGGAINDTPQTATAYAHRDALFYLQSYAVGVGGVTDTTKNFIRGVNGVITKGMPNNTLGSYAGYVDPELKDAQKAYWGVNLPRLEQIKKEVDPGDVFHNPQSVRPAGGVQTLKDGFKAETRAVLHKP